MKHLSNFSIVLVIVVICCFNSCNSNYSKYILSPGHDPVWMLGGSINSISMYDKNKIVLNWINTNFHVLDNCVNSNSNNCFNCAVSMTVDKNIYQFKLEVLLEDNEIKVWAKKIEIKRQFFDIRWIEYDVFTKAMEIKYNELIHELRVDNNK